MLLMTDMTLAFFIQNRMLRPPNRGEIAALQEHVISPSRKSVVYTQAPLKMEVWASSAEI